MPTYRLYVLAALLLTVSPIAPQLAEGEEAPRPRYELDLHLDPAGAALQGRAVVTLPAAAIEDGRARLDVAGNGVVLELDRVETAAGVAIDPSAPDGDGIVELRLPPSDPPGPVEIAVDYHRTVDETQLQPFGYWAFAPFGPSTWAYPEVVLPDGRPPRFSDFSVTLERPASLAVLTTGGTGEALAEPGVGTARSRYGADHVEGFAIVAGPGFRVTRHEEGGAVVEAFYHPDHAERFERVIERTKEAAAWYRRTYGFFPLEQIGIIQGHPNWGGGYPLPNLFAVHLGALDDDFLTWITAHELGHYYWGLHVLGDEERLDWLQLALGIWSDQLYLADRHGLSLPEQWRRGRRQGDWFADYLEALVAGKEQRLGLTAADEQALDFDYNSLIRHGKAATGLYLQSLLLGRQEFLDLQRRILERYRHRPLPEADFVALLVEAGLPGAPAFFEAWKRDDARVGVAVAEVEPDEENGGWRVGLERTGFVPYPVSVEVVTETGETVRHVVAADAGDDVVAVASRPAAVRLDPDGLVPMWNGAHPEIRSAFARALERASLDTAFLPLARAVLREVPEDHYLRYRLIRRLFWLGRYPEAADAWPAVEPCRGYDSCLGGLYAARALARAGEAEAAEALLEVLRPGAEAAGALDFWERVRAEAEG